MVVQHAPLPDSSQSEKLIGLLHAMADACVLVVGDIMLDRFVVGDVNRISPESPVPVLSIRRESKMLGGAGNALANLSGLGVKARMLTAVGDDSEGTTIRELAKGLDSQIEGILTFTDRPTTVKTRFLAGHQQLLRADFEKSGPITPALEEQILKCADKLLEGVGAVILSDYGKGLLTRAVIAGLITRAKAANIPVLVDPKGNDYSIYRGASALTPNRKELSEATRGMPTGSDEEVIKAAGFLLDSAGIDAVVATRSKDGMSVIAKDKAPVHLRTLDIEVFDVSGAGDTVIATIAAALAAGGSLVEGAALANVAGSIVVQKVGTAPIRLSELREALQSDQGDMLIRTAYDKPIDPTRLAPIASWQQAAEQVRRWQARGLKVGFTNGCFDVLHYGHVSYLNEARNRCDRLIVGLNTDSSVKVLKGPSRPVHDEKSRATVLAALGSVDMVVMFGAQEAGQDNTACALLSLIRPDLYFKGGDYTVDQIPEAPTVMANGGKVEVMKVHEGHSSTNSIARMAG